MKTKLRLMMLLLAVLLALLGSAGCSDDPLTQKTGKMETGNPDEDARGVRILEYNNNRLDYIIEAERIKRYSDRRLLYGYGVTLTAYDREGQPSSVIRADTTIVDDARNIIYANGNAVYESAEGKIRTQRMVWERTTDHITVPTFVVLTRGTDLLRGSSLRTDAHLSFVEMDRVSAEGYFDEEDLAW